MTELKREDTINEYKYLLKFRAQSGDAQSSALVCRKKWFLKNEPMEFVKIAHVQKNITKKDDVRVMITHTKETIIFYRVQLE